MKPQPKTTPARAELHRAVKRLRDQLPPNIRRAVADGFRKAIGKTGQPAKH